MSTGLHNRLAVVRVERGLSRRQLAEALGVHYQTVGYLERGQFNPSLELALQIAALFDVPVDEVFSLEPFPIEKQLPAPSAAPSAAASPVPSPPGGGRRPGDTADVEPERPRGGRRGR